MQGAEFHRRRRHCPNDILTRGIKWMFCINFHLGDLSTCLGISFWSDLLCNVALDEQLTFKRKIDLFGHSDVREEVLKHRSSETWLFWLWNQCELCAREANFINWLNEYFSKREREGVGYIIIIDVRNSNGILFICSRRTWISPFGFQCIHFKLVAM